MNNKLVLPNDGSCETSVEVSNEYNDGGSISFYTDMLSDGYDGSYISIKVSDWITVRDFIDKQIKLQGLQ